ncbi:uncharacterized protein LOC142240111 [Haematobia irritans]|uniref:uncharacterized protein LOC142240111 n=1 Tax=Haematobia irritans TaxID=7368 RepID=UPI003F502976
MIENSTKLLFIVSALCFWNYTLGFRSFSIEIDDVQYEYNDKIMSHFSLQMYNANGRNKVNGSFSFAINMNEMQLVNWVKLKKNDGKRPTIYNVSIDLCNYFGNPVTSWNPIAAGRIKILENYIQKFPKKCPVKKNRVFRVVAMYYDEALLPPYVPIVNFTGVLALVKGGTLAYKITVDCHVERIDTKRNRQTKKT